MSETGAPSPPAKAASRWLRLRWFAERYAIAHLVAYPAGVIAAFAAIPLALMLRGDRVLQAEATGASVELLARIGAVLKLDPLQAAQMEIVLEFVLLCAALTLVVPHLTAVPWAWAASARRTSPNPQVRDEKLARRLRGFITSMLVLSGIWLLVGVAGWVWLLTL